MNKLGAVVILMMLTPLLMLGGAVLAGLCVAKTIIDVWDT